VRELLIISQDTSAYGLDIRYRTDFWQGRPLRTDIETLARGLGELPAWVRLHYVYPYPQVDRLIPLMADELILPYLDMPLQHGSPPCSRPCAARRPPRRSWTGCQLAPHLPGAGAAQHLHRRLPRRDRGRLRPAAGLSARGPARPRRLLRLLARRRRRRQRAADPVPEALKQERLERFMAVQAEISRAKLAARVGQRMIVLVDEVEEDRIIARSHADAPEIDGNVIIDGAWEIAPGDFIEVDITASAEHDLFAQPVRWQSTLAKPRRRRQVPRDTALPFS
jgi:ribosomal protein S12 methylthiotransferase